MPMLKLFEQCLEYTLNWRMEITSLVLYFWYDARRRYDIGKVLRYRYWQDMAIIIGIGNIIITPQPFSQHERNNCWNINVLVTVHRNIPKLDLFFWCPELWAATSASVAKSPFPTSWIVVCTSFSQNASSWFDSKLAANWLSAIRTIHTSTCRFASN